MFGSIIKAGASLLGGILDNESRQDAGEANAALQREFAQNGIRWKVEDAKAAGIHPLYAIGAQTHAASPSYVGGDSFSTSLSEFGQDIGRAVDSTRTHDERVKARVDELTVERGELENAILRSQLAKMDASPTPPTPGSNYNLPGQPQSGLIDLVPSTSIAGHPDNPGFEAATPPGVKGYIMPDGGTFTAPSPEMAEALESSWLYGMEHYLRNRVYAPLAWGAKRARDAYNNWQPPLYSEYLERR